MSPFSIIVAKRLKFISRIMHYTTCCFSGFLELLLLSTRCSSGYTPYLVACTTHVFPYLSNRLHVLSSQSVVRGCVQGTTRRSVKWPSSMTRGTRAKRCSAWYWGRRPAPRSVAPLSARGTSHRSSLRTTATVSIRQREEGGTCSGMER